MKKIVRSVLVLVFLASIFPFAATAHTEEEPLMVDLLAGQNADVGDVLVWNDPENLYVEYKLTGDWCLRETHVAVGTALDEIPQTKKNNPIPGQFDYSEKFGIPPCVQNPDPFVIPNSWADGTEVYIAAHASVSRPLDGCFEEVWQIGDVEAVNAGTGWLENYADEFNWGAPAGPTTMGPNLIQEQPAFANPFVVGTTPDKEFPYNSNSVRNYATDFDVQWDGSLPFGGLLTISWSPGQSATEVKTLSNSFPSETFTVKGEPRQGEGFFMDKYGLVENSVSVGALSDGTHTINFKHSKGDGTFWDWLRMEKVCEQNETAWGKGEDFAGSNWATYITYTIQAPPPPPEPVCPELVDMSGNVEVLNSIPSNIQVGALENDQYVRVWKEFDGTLSSALAYDLEEGRRAKADGPAGGSQAVPSGSEVCVYYVHLDNVGPSSTVSKSGFLEFSGNVAGLIISGGDLGTFANKDLMFDADSAIGDAGTIYPDKSSTPDYWRGFDVNHVGNLDDAVFNGNRVDFTMWVVNAHDSFRVILPKVTPE